MTRLVLDASAVLHVAGAGIEVAASHELLAPTLLRSQTLPALHEAVQRVSSAQRSPGTVSPTPSPSYRARPGASRN